VIAVESGVYERMTIFLSFEEKKMWDANLLILFPFFCCELWVGVKYLNQVYF